MSSADNQKDVIRAINAYMLTALLSIFITGVVLILLVFLFGIQIFGMNPNTNFYVVIFQLCTIIVLILGLVFISLGIFQSIRLMKSMKKITDSILSGDFFEIITKTSKSSGIGGRLNIIRPPMKSKETTPPNQKSPTSKVQPTTKSKQEIKQKTKERMKKETPKAKSTSEKEETEFDEELDISLEEALQKIVDRYDEPKVSSAFSKWDDTLMMTFPDLETSYLYKINRDQGIELVEGYEEDAAVQVKIDSDIFIKMMTKQINPIKAYSSGKLEVVGKMRSLLKLRKLMF